MKKLMSVLLVLAMVVPMLLVVPVSAEGIAITVTGIANGDRFIANAGIAKKVSVVAENEADVINKVEFLVNDTLLGTDTETPFEFTLPTTASYLSNDAAQTLTIRTYSDETTYADSTYTYYALVGVIRTENIQTYENFGEVANQVVTGSAEEAYKATVATSSMTDGKALKIPSHVIAQYTSLKNKVALDATTTYANYKTDFRGTTSLNAGTKIGYMEFDAYTTGIGKYVRFDLGWAWGQADITSGVLIVDDKGSNFAPNTVHKVKILLDVQNHKYVTYVDGVEVKRGDMDTDYVSGVYLYVDNSYDTEDNAGDFYIDNYRTVTYDTRDLATSPITAKAVKGIASDEIIVLNAEKTRQVGVIEQSNVAASYAAMALPSTWTNATDLTSVKFELDSKPAVVVTSAPYVYNMPIDEVGSHTLTVTTTDFIGNETPATYNFTVVAGDVIGGYSADFEDCTDLKEQANLATNAATEGAYMLTTKGGNTWAGMAPFTVGYSGQTEIGFQPSSPSVVAPSNTENYQVSYVDFDAYYVGNSTAKLRTMFKMRDMIGAGTTNTFLNFNWNVPAGVSYVAVNSVNDPASASFTEIDESKIVHFTFKLDFVNMKYTAYINGYEYFRGDLAAGTSVAKNTNVFSINTTADGQDNRLYVDNFKITNYNRTGFDIDWANATDKTIGAGDGATFAAAMKVHNSTGEAVNNLMNIYAIYDSEGVLESASAEIYNAASNASTSKEYTFTGLTAGKQIKMYTWDSLTNKPYTIPGA